MELEEVTTGEEETLRPQVRERSGSKKYFRNSHIRVSEDSATTFQNQVYALFPLPLSPIARLSQLPLINRGNCRLTY